MLGVVLGFGGVAASIFLVFGEFCACCEWLLCDEA